MILRSTALCLVLAWSSAAAADEPMRTAGASASPPAAVGDPAPPIASMPPAMADAKAQEIGDWARRVIAGEPSAEARAEARPRCPAPPDRKPHGEVWAGIGTGGYREIGAVVTQPIGECGSLTLGISRTESGYGRRFRR